MDTSLHEDYQDLAEKQAEFESALLALPNVIGLAIGRRYKADIAYDDEGPVVSVFVEQKLPPKQLQNNELVGNIVNSEFPVDVVNMGHFRTCQIPKLDREIRPAMGGFSIGHFLGTGGTGTLGTCCYDAFALPGTPPNTYILSNNHVIANNNAANIGDAILQPSLFDGGVDPSDVIARLSRFVPINFHTQNSKPSNHVDAAIAEGELRHLSREIYWTGYLRGTYTPPKVGDYVQKTGRTTGFTTGQVENVNAMIDVHYPGVGVARFYDQIFTSYMSSGGDSGSIVATFDQQPVGLLFADSFVESRSIVNPIWRVEDELDIRVIEHRMP